MNKCYGPFELLAGNHTEDCPRRQVKVKHIDGPNLFTEDGARLFADLTSGNVQDRGEAFACYLGDRKMSCLDLREGDTVTLAQPVKYGPKDQPFMSVADLEAKFNQNPVVNERGVCTFSGSRKFERVNADAPRVAEQQQAIAAKDGRIAELEAELLRLRSQTPGVPAATAAPKYLLDDLKKKSVAELRALAAEEEIDLGRASRHEDIVAAIHAAL